MASEDRRETVTRANVGPAVKSLTEGARAAGTTLQDRLKNAPQLRSVAARRHHLDEATAALGEAEEAIVEASIELGQAVGETKRHATLAAQAAAQRLDQMATAISAAVDALPYHLVAPFDDPRWADFQPLALPTALAGPNGQLLRWGRAPTARPTGPGWLPFQALPFVGGGAAWVIAADDSATAAAHNLLQALVVRIACQFPQRAKFTFIDPLGRGLTFPMQGLLQPNVRFASQDLWQDLGHIEADITRILLEVVRRQGSFEKVPAEQQTAEKYEFIFAADFPKARAYDRRVTEKLLEIGRIGPRAGRYLILHRTLDHELPRDVSLDELGKPHTLTLKGAGPFLTDEPPSAEVEERILRALESAPQANRAKPLRQVLPPPANWWQGDAATHIEASLDGQKDGLEVFFGQKPFGGQTAYHGILAAATGMGKSNLLHALILGLATRYSPDELQLYLLDLKQGVEFKAYETLPHAAVIAFNTDPALARAVLDELQQEAGRRYREILRPSGAQDFAHYRRMGQPQGPLARILLVIDEYQALFHGGDATAVSRNLADLAAQGRAAGINILLGSQSFRASGLQQAESLFMNLSLRMALKMQPAAITAMTEFQAEGKRMLFGCDVPGKLVLNTSSGADGANRLGQVVEVKSEDRQAVLAQIATLAEPADKARRQTWPKTQIFDGDSALSPDENALLFFKRLAGSALDARVLSALARMDRSKRGFGFADWREQDGAIPLVFGREYAVHGQALAVLGRLPAQNLLLMAAGNAVRGALLGALCDSLGALDPTVRGDLVVLDRSGDAAVAATLGRLGARSAPDAIAAAETGPGVLILVEPERMPDLVRPSDPLAPRPPAVDALERRLRDGPASGRHTVVVTSGMAALGRVIARRAVVQHFAWMALGQMSQEDSQDLIGNRQAAQLSDPGRVGPEPALLADMASNRFTRFAPFAPRV